MHTTRFTRGFDFNSIRTLIKSAPGQIAAEKIRLKALVREGEERIEAVRAEWEAQLKAREREDRKNTDSFQRFRNRHAKLVYR